MCEYVVSVDELDIIDTLNLKKAMAAYKKALKQKASFTAIYKKMGDKLVAIKYKMRKK